MKLIKKTFNIFLIIVLLMISFVTPVYRVQAKTLGQMKAELTQKEEEYAKLKEEKELTEAERQKTKEQIAVNENKIVSLKNENIALDKEIAKLNNSIEEKYAEIKKILNYFQVSSGESGYLEYIFGAKTFTDFIYRASIAEQLSNYNKGLIEEYDNSIKESKKKQEEIVNRQNQIASLQEELTKQYAKLGQEITNLNDDMLSAEEETKLLKANILELQNTYKCSDTEEISVCKERAIKSNTIPASTGSFKRPINNAVVTGNYGWYDPYYNGNVTWHAAMDLAGDSGAKIYASAAGKVVDVHHASCGNWIIYIAHNVNGVRYTTGYWHLRKAYVSVGELVSADTVIGIQGGLRSEDTCSSGEHLDFVFTLGAYKIDYFVNPRSISVDPREYIFFPKLIEKATGVGTSVEWTTR